jgi:hypothetical protein
MGGIIIPQTDLLDFVSEEIHKSENVTNGPAFGPVIEQDRRHRRMHVVGKT